MTTTTTGVDSRSTTIEELRSEATVSIPRAAQVLGVSRSYAYQLAAAGDLPVIRLGAKRVRVPTVALRRMLGIED